jgi:hypothetical protein
MMAETSPNLWCTTNQSAVKKQLVLLQSKAFKHEMVRLLAFALIFIGPFLSSYFPNPIKAICWSSIPIGIFIFVNAVRKHQILKDDIYYLTNTLDAIEQSLKLLENTQNPIGPFKRPPEVIRPNEEHWPLSLQETDDLDVYSEGASIFGRINRATTVKGQQYLAGLIESPLLQVNDITNRSNTYQDLANQIETLHLLAGNAKAFAEIKDQFQSLKEAIETRSNIQETIWPNFIKIYLPILLIVVSLSIYGVIPQPFLILALLANIVIAKKIGSVIFPALKPWLSISSLLNYSEMYLQQAIKLDTKNGPLAPLTAKSKSLLTTGNLSALKNTVGMIRLRFSGVIHMIVDVAVFWDIRWMIKLEKLMTNRSAFLELENIIGEWEAHISMALQNFINHNGTFAELHSANNCEITEGCHPLLPTNKSVPNDISLHDKDRAWLISGSNMSGKSTFLRMVGVNILFAQIGLKTYTKKTKTCPVRLMTDLRIRDNLFKNESYFLAEVRQLKRMIDTSKGKPLLFGLIDEPYRGTNSEERIAASVEVLRCLLESGGFFLTATHDKEVTEMAEQIPAVSNHHFKEELSESDIAFDYKIRSGPTTTRNALRVLQQEGYPDSVIQNAEAWLQKKNKNTRQF